MVYLKFIIIIQFENHQKTYEFIYLIDDIIRDQMLQFTLEDKSVLKMWIFTIGQKALTRKPEWIIEEDKDSVLKTMKRTQKFLEVCTVV